MAGHATPFPAHARRRDAWEGGTHAALHSRTDGGACVAGAGAAHTPPLPAHNRGRVGTRATLKESWYCRRYRQETTNKAAQAKDTSKTSTKPTSKQGSETGQERRAKGAQKRSASNRSRRRCRTTDDSSGPAPRPPRSEKRIRREESPKWLGKTQQSTKWHGPVRVWLHPPVPWRAQRARARARGLRVRERVALARKRGVRHASWPARARKPGLLGLQLPLQLGQPGLRLPQLQGRARGARAQTGTQQQPALAKRGQG